MSENIGIKNSKSYQIALYVFLSFLFSVAVRFIWIYQFSNIQSFFWNGQFMINTNDGYYFAEGARDILAGFHQDGDLSPVYVAMSKLTAIFAKILPFSFESIILYMSTFLSSLIVIPLILLGRSIKRTEVGFIAALFGAIVWSYYNRTMVGYYDTDMLNIVLPTFLLSFLVLSFQTRDFKYLLFSSLTVICYKWWYPQSYALVLSVFGLIFIYTILFERKNEYLYKLLILLLLSVVNIQDEIKLIAITILLFIFFKKFLNLRVLLLFLVLSVVVFMATGGIEPIWGLLKGYVFKNTISTTSDGFKLHFFTVMQTIREAGSIPFEVFANRISGHVITFFISLVGYMYLCFKHRVMLLGLPLLGLGFLAYSGGLRFTVYAVPVMALGVAYLIVKIADFVEKPVLKFVFIATMTIAILAPNIKHVIEYRVPTVFVKSEVEILDKLKNIASREDYVVSWWDYGYPIRYYADVKTLIDGGKHSGEVNFAPSFILTHPQQEAANLARLDVEYTERRFRDRNMPHSNIAQMMQDYGFSSASSFLESLSKDIKLPKKTRDVYLYLPFKMGSIYPTITKFSSLDLMSGKSHRQPFFYQTSYFQDNGTMLNLGDDIALNKKTNVLHIGKGQALIKTFYMVGYNKDGKFSKKVQNLHPNGTLSIVFAKSYGTFFIMDEATLKSVYVQLFLLENYDKELFELVIQNPYAKVYKLKK